MPMPAKTTESLTHFDANAIAAAQTAPTLSVGRFLYRGRLLSIEEWLPFWDRLQALEAQQPGTDSSEARARLRARIAFHRDFLRAQFPKRDFRFWAPDPVKHLLAQPFDIVEQTVGFFFTLQARATFGSDAMQAAAKTAGINSPPSTTSPVGGRA